MLNAAFPVGAALKTLMLSGFSPGIVLRYLSSAWYNALVTVLFPTPVPPLKNDLKGSSLVLIECSTW